jgi:hypothetical protein
MTRLPTAVLTLLALGVAAPVHAQDNPTPRKVSVTVSPLHLLNPQIHVTGEVRLAPRMGAAAILGAGRVTDEGQTYRIWEVGGQFRYYIVGSFTHGMMLGADVGYVDVNGQMANAMQYLVGTRAGGFLGYKRTLRSGFTAEAQIGPLYVWGDAGNSEPQTLLNLKVGWSF